MNEFFPIHFYLNSTLAMISSINSLRVFLHHGNLGCNMKGRVSQLLPVFCVHVPPFYLWKQELENGLHCDTQQTGHGF